MKFKSQDIQVQESRVMIKVYDTHGGYIWVTIAKFNHIKGIDSDKLARDYAESITEK